MPLRLLSKLPIPLPIQQPLQLLDIAQLNLRQPPVALWTLVDGARCVFQHAVGFDDLSGNGGHDVGGGFDGLDGAHGVAFGYGEVEGGELDEDDVAEGGGGVGGYAYGAWRYIREKGRVEVGVGAGRSVPVLPSEESSIHSWSSVYFFSDTVAYVRRDNTGDVASRTSRASSKAPNHWLEGRSLCSQS